MDHHQYRGSHEKERKLLTGQSLSVACLMKKSHDSSESILTTLDFLAFACPAILFPFVVESQQRTRYSCSKLPLSPYITAQLASLNGVT
ncbi:hypothetical protein SADUNF_Sadunf11G0096500 [Salix dunnii]|uniref:Uncharacterized protein n=1 Tax=Salix dunnii TaxID=1413687 RepID=A0A835JQX7_9ROSI|nr:hypothetical protein SADUNF_Sadunf11G0096500 [Salix dunnii]